MGKTLPLPPHTSPRKPKVGEPVGNLQASPPKRLLQMGLQHCIFFPGEGREKEGRRGGEMGKGKTAGHIFLLKSALGKGAGSGQAAALTQAATASEDVGLNGGHEVSLSFKFLAHTRPTSKKKTHYSSQQLELCPSPQKSSCRIAMFWCFDAIAHTGNKQHVKGKRHGTCCATPCHLILASLVSTSLSSSLAGLWGDIISLPLLFIPVTCGQSAQQDHRHRPASPDRLSGRGNATHFPAACTCAKSKCHP